MNHLEFRLDTLFIPAMFLISEPPAYFSSDLLLALNRYLHTYLQRLQQVYCLSLSEVKISTTLKLIPGHI